MKKVLVLGSEGMLGRSLCCRLGKMKSFELVKVLHSECDIRKQSEVLEIICDESPDVVVNCAAMTAVDKCEERVEEAFKTNALGAFNVALACKKAGAKLIHISTDYVHSGDVVFQNRPAGYREDDVSIPKNVYGSSKLCGDLSIMSVLGKNALILRTAWLFGSGGPSFVHKIMELGTTGDQFSKPISVVCDQSGNPTSADFLSYAIAKLLRRKTFVGGVLNCACSGFTTWYSFAQAIQRIAGPERFRRLVVPCSSGWYKTKAERPARTKLDLEKLESLGIDPPYWKYELEKFMKKEFGKTLKTKATV